MSRAPVGLALFLGSMGIMEGRDGRHIQEKFRDLYKPLIITNWQVWPLVQVSDSTVLQALFSLVAHRVTSS